MHNVAQLLDKHTLLMLNLVTTLIFNSLIRNALCNMDDNSYAFGK